LRGLKTEVTNQLPSHIHTATEHTTAIRIYSDKVN